MHAALAETPASVSYHDVEKLIHYICGMFNRRFGGDYEEQVSEANVTYQKVYLSFDPAKGSFTNLLCQSIWRRLTSLNRKGMRHYTLSLDAYDGDNCLMDGLADPTPPATRAKELLEDLSPDARLVAGLVISPPDAIETIAKGKGGFPANWSSTVRAYLRDMGWATARIAESFDEIRRALL
jgi:hypothetical protein